MISFHTVSVYKIHTQSIEYGTIIEEKLVKVPSCKIEPETTWLNNRLIQSDIWLSG